MKKLLILLVMIATNLLTSYGQVVFTSGNGTEDDPYWISSIADLGELATAVNGGERFEGTHFACSAKELDFGGLPFISIGYFKTDYFAGTFDGHGVVIKNLKPICSDALYADQFSSLFGYTTESAVIKNITIESFESQQLEYDGAPLVYMNYGTVENCTNRSSLAGRNIGGLVYYNYGTVKGCSNYGNSDDTPTFIRSIGGIVNTNFGDIIDCTNYGNITSSNWAAGGIACESYNGEGKRLTVSGCHNYGAIGGVSVGGIIGLIGECDVKDCHNDGELNGTSVGGIVGARLDRRYNEQTYTFNGCTNKGTITAKNEGGGISGKENGGIDGLCIVDILKCSNSGQISGTTVGGIVGSHSRGNINGCENTGTMDGKEDTGGIAGNIGKTTSVADCTNSGTVGGRVSLINNVARGGGGIVGLNHGTISNCTNSGEIKGGGGIVSTNGGIVENCFNTGYINSSYADCGGIVSLNGTWNSGYIIRNCVNQGKVESANSSGGIAATCDEDCTIDNCTNEGDVIGSRAGGICALVGSSEGEKGSISNNRVRKCTISGSEAFAIVYDRNFIGHHNFYDYDVVVINKDETLDGFTQRGLYTDGNQINFADGVKDCKAMLWPIDDEGYLRFADKTTEAICLKAWDRNGDGKLSFEEAKAVTTIGTEFKASEITTFNELQMFEGLTTIGDDAFAGCSSLKAFNIPASVTTLGYRIFDGCIISWPTKNIPGLTVDSDNAYFSADGINVYSKDETIYKFRIPITSDGVAVQISPKINKIDSYAFYNQKLSRVSSNLASSTYSFDNVTELGDAVFQNCSAMTTLSLPPVLTTIGTACFVGCESLKSFTVAEDNEVFSAPGGILYKETELFAYPNKKGNSYTMREGTTSVAPYAFCQTEITKITMPAEMKAIGEYAFAECENLSVIILKSTTPPTLPDNAFSSQTYSQAFLKVPAECKAAYQAAEGWKNFTRILDPSDDLKADDTFSKELNGHNIPFLVLSAEDKTCQIGIYTKPTDGMMEVAINHTNHPNLTDYTIEVPSTLFGPDGNYYKVVAVGYKAFYEDYLLTGITLPASVTSIDDQAFMGTSLSSIIIPANVTNIGEMVLTNCSKLTSIVVESGNTVYDSRKTCNAIIRTADNTLIQGCNKSTIQKTVTAIAPRAFYGCNGIKSISIPSSVKTIGEEAFYMCSKLTTISIPASVEAIGSGAFLYCSSVTSIKVNSSNPIFNSQNNAIIRTADKALILGCQKTVIPSDITSIADRAFYYCSGLKTISIPASVTSIGDEAFFGCSDLETIKVDVNNSFYDSRDNCNAIIETATNRLFIGSAKTVIPVGITAINDYAFLNNQGLSSINIPWTVSSIGYKAFADCNKLTVINVGIKVPLDISSYTFSNYANATLYVPKGSKEAYASAKVWKDFATIEEIEETYTSNDIVQAVNSIASGQYNSHFDVNYDGILNIADIIMIAQKIIQLAQ